MNNHEQEQHEDDIPEGAQTGGGFSGHYLSIAGPKHPQRGKFVERVKEGVPGAIRRTIKRTIKADDGSKKEIEVDIYEKAYQTFAGKVEVIENRERTVNFSGTPEQRHSTVLTMSAGGELYRVEMEHNERAWPYFVGALATEKINFDKVLKLKPWDYEKKGTKVRTAGVGLFQKATPEQIAAAALPGATIKLQEDGTVQVPLRWNKENPGKVPQPYKLKDANGNDIIVNGKPLWSFVERDNYLRSVVEHYAAKLRKMHDDKMSAAEVQAGATPAPAPVAQAAPVSQQGPPDFDPDDNEPPPFADFGAGGSSEEDSLPF